MMRVRENMQLVSEPSACMPLPVPRPLIVTFMNLQFVQLPMSIPMLSPPRLRFTFCMVTSWSTPSVIPTFDEDMVEPWKS
ncbi:Uncharacterised protein [uncultured archaeon]|nr:Uncharacterised protein [uncultured archaeon]